MKRGTFNYLCDKLRPSIVWQDTRVRTAVGVEQRVVWYSAQKYLYNITLPNPA